MSDKELRIQKLIVHILDNTTGIPILSEKEHPLEGEIEEFFSKHLIKILKDGDLKNAQFINESNNKIKTLCECFKRDTDQFVTNSKALALNLFELLNKYVEIPPADLAICYFTINTSPYLAILKLNYRPSFIHLVSQDDEGLLNSIIKQKTSLPNEGQKIDECALISLNDFSLKLIEKKYDLNGEKEFYFSNLFLQCTSDISAKEKVKLLEKTTKKFIEKHCEDELEKIVNFKIAVKESIEERNKIDIMHVAENTFKGNSELKRNYVEEIQKKLSEDRFVVQQSAEKPSMRKQKLITDSGIEINFPLEEFSNHDKVEFINNHDGTISILLKNITSFNEK